MRIEEEEGEVLLLPLGPLFPSLFHAINALEGTKRCEQKQSRAAWLFWIAVLVDSRKKGDHETPPVVRLKVDWIFFSLRNGRGKIEKCCDPLTGKKQTVPVLSDKGGDGHFFLVKDALCLKVVWNDFGRLHCCTEHLGEEKAFIH